MKLEDITVGMPVRLDPKQWSDFIDTSLIGIVIAISQGTSTRSKKKLSGIQVMFTDGTLECYNPRHLREVKSTPHE
jgi:hypothetical protein